MRFERYRRSVHFARGADDAFKCERFIGLYLFFRHRSVFRASWRARVFVDSAAAICLRNYYRKRPCLLRPVPTVHLHKPEEGFLTGVLVHADAAHLVDRFVASSSNTGTILMDRTTERVRRDANNQWRAASVLRPAL